MDTLTKTARSKNMAAIKAENTQPELLLRRYLHRQGYRYSLHKDSLPGKPDIFLRKHSTIIFVHGCFWHQHRNCKDAGNPKSNRKFWYSKLKANVERDERNKKALRKLGYKVIVVWECEINKRSWTLIENRI
jgi:DNA mismatch endonuclease (patch repair protein)